MKMKNLATKIVGLGGSKKTLNFCSLNSHPKK